MGNWHCVTSGCAEVVYQEYLPPSIRWRYPGEAWQEIIGADDYSLQIVNNLTQNTDYQLVYRQPIIQNAVLQGWSQEYTGSIGAWNGISSWRLKFIQNGLSFYASDNKYTIATSNPSDFPPPSKRSVRVDIEGVSQGQTITKLISGGNFGLWGIRVQQSNSSLHSQSCIFTITKNGNIVHQQTRSVCPEVEKLPCRLSDQIKTIEIEKFPWLERVEVVDYFYDVRLGGLIDSDNYGLLLSKGKIPDQCLNIYKNSITSIIPNDFISITNTPENGFNLIAQICSAPGCSPPQYQVICDCECQSCPDGTHPITCGSSVCCYGSDGKVSLEIPIENYCGGDSCCE